MGADVNIGAGTVTCNYDGEQKHRTRIGDGAFIGSDTMLVAPVTVGERARTGRRRRGDARRGARRVRRGRAGGVCVADRSSDDGDDGDGDGARSTEGGS